MTTPPLFSAIALTLFPDMFPGPLGFSLAGKALEKNIWSLRALDIRGFATDRHATVDDSPYGGGTGMVMKPDVVDSAVEHAKTLLPSAQVIYTTPRGRPLTQALAGEIKSRDAIILCGRFEGVDHRVIEHHDMLEVSLGDFVLSGGEIAALAMLDAVVRLLPGVIKNTQAIEEESFSANAAGGENESDFSLLLEYPHYTRPSLWKGRPVPEVLLSGNHEQIRAWRLEQARKVTEARRPDMWTKFAARMDERGED